MIKVNLIPTKRKKAETGTGISHLCCPAHDNDRCDPCPMSCISSVRVLPTVRQRSGKMILKIAELKEKIKAVEDLKS